MNRDREAARDLSIRLEKAQEEIARLRDDFLAEKVAFNCHDKDHDDRWCPTCEDRYAGIDEYRQTLKNLGGDKP